MRYSCIFALFFCALNIGLIGFVSNAQAVPKDRMYFLKNDGIFSEEEKDEEALYVYEKCKKNLSYNSFFECSCVAGVFRMERETSEQRQSIILLDIYRNIKSPCINAPGIAGSSYERCKENYKNSSDLIRKGISLERMCQCYGSYFTESYMKKPLFTTKHIMHLQKKANIACRSAPIMDKFGTKNE